MSDLREPEEPGDDALARMFAAEESAIRDDGFSRRVVAKAHDGIGWRRTAVYGAGMAGFGVAVASIIDLAPHLPAMTGWFDGVSAELREVGQGGFDPMLITVAAVIAGVSFTLVAVFAQER
ncbi:MAG TPA: hypothetical protein PLH23_10740 [Hyphomonadaceae bacterium]|nr:hypothetical protein [Hyphomonadaceae bacterium]HPI48736.1 hypothetical protein [Hyphomonadaceae bacterium]